MGAELMEDGELKEWVSAVFDNGFNGLKIFCAYNHSERVAMELFEMGVRFFCLAPYVRGKYRKIVVF